jgi:hypothetical protein
MKVAEYLLENYYKKYDKVKECPTIEHVEAFLDVVRDRIVVVRNKGIKCVSIWMTLTDETYNKLESLDFSIETTRELLQEKGKNFHFIILVAQGMKYILQGMFRVKKKNPKTISWWNPAGTKLHRYNLN